MLRLLCRKSNRKEIIKFRIQIREACKRGERRPKDLVGAVLERLEDIFRPDLGRAHAAARREYALAGSCP